MEKKKLKIKHPKHRSGDPPTQEQEKLPLTGWKLVQDQVGMGVRPGGRQLNKLEEEDMEEDRKG